MQFSHSSNEPLVTSILMHTRGVSSYIEAMQTIVDQVKTGLEKAYANLTVALILAKSLVYYSRRGEEFKVGDKVVPPIPNLCMSQHIPSKLWRGWI